MSDKIKIRVPKEAGDEITLRLGGADPVTYKVTQGTVVVPDEATATALVAAVDGAERIGDATPPAEAGKES